MFWVVVVVVVVVLGALGWWANGRGSVDHANVRRGRTADGARGESLGGGGGGTYGAGPS